MPNNKEQLSNEYDPLEGFGSNDIYNGKIKRENPKDLTKKENNRQNVKVEKKDEEKSKREFVIYKYSQMGKGELYEGVIINGLSSFTRYNHESRQFEVVEKIEENNRILKPPEREEYPYIPYEFSCLKEINYYKDKIINENIDIDYLFQKSKSIISKYNNQDEYKLNLISADVLVSYFQDRFSTIHYDYIVGGNGSGKSSLGDTFGAIAYRAVNLTDPTAPNLFRLLGSVEPAQCTLILEEAERIDKSPELMAILKTGYGRNGRVPKINPNTLKQEFFFSFCQKVIISEKSLNQSIARGVNTRILSINCFKGQAKYDIKEILNPTDTGGSQNKELMKELEDFRKLLLVYRLMHFKDPIPDLDIGVEGRDKELVKHLIQLFYGSNSLNHEVIKSLQIFLDLKNQKKDSSFDYALLPLISTLIKENGPRVLFRTFWNALKENIPGKEDEKKPNEYHTEDFGTLYRSTITNFLSDVFGAKTEHKRDGNILIFDPEVIEKLSLVDKTKIVVTEQNSIKKEENSEVKRNESLSHCESVKSVSTPDQGVPIDIGKKDIEIQNSFDSSLLVNENPLKESSSSTPLSDAFTPFTHSRNKEKEENGFKNPLISKQDLFCGNYDPNIINNIDRFEGTDRWFCKNCTLRGDKWFMMKHPCNNNKKGEERSQN